MSSYPWIKIQYLIVALYFALAIVIWGMIDWPSLILFFGLFALPLFLFFRLQHLANTRRLLSKKSLQTISLCLLFIGFFFVVLTAILKLTYWVILDSLFGVNQDKQHILWAIGQGVFLVLGFIIVASLVMHWWLHKFSDEEVRSELRELGGIIFELLKIWKVVLFCIFTMLITVLSFCAFGGLCVLFELYSFSEVFDTWDAGNESKRYVLPLGTFVLSLVPIYYLSHLMYPKVQLTALFDAGGLRSQ
ncbi:MAG: hypothetical protein OXG88_12105 [Gammaproteobacteria bacterium]|nr:hypothetical protein [Gammaproteobacteria bacterium]